MKQKRHTITSIQKQKSVKPIVCLTSYTAPSAKILDPYVDILLVGDTVGMVLYGMDSTLGVTVPTMIAHGKAVVKASTKALVVVDMPFGSYQRSPEDAFSHASAILSETGCQAVKLEGGKEMADTVRFLVERGIPVVGHIGLMPQHVHSTGGYRYQGRDKESAQKILTDAAAIEQAGASLMVIEGTAEPLARKITQRLSIPTIGIGASPACDGQVLVTEDMAGFFAEFTPKFVKRYGNVSSELEKAVKAFSEDVRNRVFPSKEECYT